MSCSPSSPSPQPQINANISEPLPAAETPEATWGNDMTYGFLRDEKEKTVAFVRATLGPRQEAYTAHRVGNLAFAEIITAPNPNVPYDQETRQYVAVILGEKPRLVSLPDKALFAHFAKNVRPNPDVIDSDNRIWTALLLATGLGGLERKPAPPTWTDEDSTLIIHYYRHIADIDELILQECTLTVDANQDYTLECIDLGPPSE